jgi:hypothetical protein
MGADYLNFVVNDGFAGGRVSCLPAREFWAMFTVKEVLNTTLNERLALENQLRLAQGPEAHEHVTWRPPVESDRGIEGIDFPVRHGIRGIDY